MRLEEGKHQTEKDIAETTKQRKRKNEITCEKSEYTYDDTSTNSDGGWPPEPASERQVRWGFFKIRAQDANGHIMEIQVPAYKKPRRGTSDNEITNTELILAEGYVIQQCRPDI
jgi:predicted lactoylglutathione lyase